MNKDFTNLKYTDLLNKLLEGNAKKIKTFPDVMNTTANLKREMTIGDIDEEVGETVEAIIKYWNKVDDELNIPIEERLPIKIYIDSSGGSLHATFTIIDAIKLSKTPIYTINIGMAFSGGFFIFLAGHKRIAYPHSVFLYHEGSTGMGRQDAGKFRNYAAFYERLLLELKAVVLENTKITEEEYEKHKLDDWWIYTDEALEKSICDEIATKFV